MVRNCDLDSFDCDKKSYSIMKVYEVESNVLIDLDDNIIIFHHYRKNITNEVWLEYYM